MGAHSRTLTILVERTKLTPPAAGKIPKSRPPTRTISACVCGNKAVGAPDAACSSGLAVLDELLLTIAEMMACSSDRYSS